MIALIHVLAFLSVLGLAAAGMLVVPEATGWPEEAVWVLAVGLVAGGVLAQSAALYRRSARRLEDSELERHRLGARLDRLETELRMLEERSQSGDERSAEMVHEMRVLQTLLGQIVSGRGTGARPKATAAASAAGSRNREGAAAESAGPPPAISEEELQEILRGALSENRVDLYLQPIVTLPSRKTLHYECFSRVRGEDGRIVYPKDYIPVAESAGMIGTLDNLLLFRCIQLVRKLGPRRPEASFFCNISSASLHDDDFFPQFVEYMASNAELAERLVFEFSHADFRALAEAERRRLASLGRAGYRFSIDHVESRRIDPQGLADQHVGFVKMDYDVLFEGADEPDARTLSNRLHRRGIALIASKVETNDQVLDLLELDTGLAQGYLFGEPRPSREDTPAAAAAGN